MAYIGSVRATSETNFVVLVYSLKAGERYKCRGMYDSDDMYGREEYCSAGTATADEDGYARFSGSTSGGKTVANVRQIKILTADAYGTTVISQGVSLSYTPSTPSVTTPSSISYSTSINSYNSTRITWGSVSGATSYVLERSINGGSFSQVYSGTATSYTDYGLNSSTTRVQYRVKAVNSGGSSSYKTGSTATVYYSKPNVAPTVPSSITVPSTVYGGRAFTVSWGKSTDSDGNLSGYKLEKSVNGGSTWTQIYQGSSTSTSVTLTFGEATQVMFRVRAYDSSGAHSGYKASGTSTVVNNKAPTAPQSITVPLNIYGGKTAVVTWTAATDSDNNLSGYILERSVNSGTYTQIYKGANKSYSDNITKGWNTVQYRVCAYDSYNEKGAYKTAQVRNIINNELPVITTSSTNLGLKTGAFSFSYTVSDQESNKLTVVEKINGVQKKSFTATSGSTYTFQITQQEFICILNGTNTLSITVTDTDGGVTTKNITFQKQENEIAFTLKTPFETDAEASVGIMNVVRQIPEGADFIIEACNNAYDTSPTWEDVTRFVREGRNFILLNEQKTASKWGFSFRVTVTRNTATGEIYISSVGGNFK